MRSILLLILLFLTSCINIENREAEYATMLTGSAADISTMAGSGYSIPAPSPVMPPKPAAGPRMAGVAPAKKSVTKAAAKDSITQQLHPASMVFRIPDKANIKESIRAQLLIDPSKNLKELEKELTGKGVISTHSIVVSKIILASLVAPDFNVSKITPERQAITQTQPTEWLWELEPKESGIHTIDLSITAIITIDGDKSEHHIKTFNKSIKIEITPKQVAAEWFSKYWQWLFTTLLLPLGLWMYKEKIKVQSS